MYVTLFLQIQVKAINVPLVELVVIQCPPHQLLLVPYQVLPYSLPREHTIHQMVNS